MAQAQKDNNNVDTIIGVSNADGETVLNATADPSTHILDCDCGAGGSDIGGDDANRDENMVTTLIAVSSDDGITPVPIFIDATTNKILINSA